MKLPLYESDFELLKKKVAAFKVSSIENENLRIQDEGFPEEYFSVYSIPIKDLPENEYVEPLMHWFSEKIDEALLPIETLDISSILTNAFSGDELLIKRILYKIEDIFEDMYQSIFFYDYKTNLIDDNKAIILSIDEDTKTVYVYYQMLLYVKHLEETINYLTARNKEILDKNLQNFNYGYFSYHNHWTHGIENIGNTLSKLDSAICTSSNKLSYALEYFSEEHVLFSFIFTINK